MSRDYITLVASLPHLPYFEQADRLPITERALTQRLSMLNSEDALQLRRSVDLLGWRRHPVGTQTEFIEKQYRAAMQKTSDVALREYVDWLIGGRTAIAALRLKSRGQAVRPEMPWGAGRLVKRIEANWSKPYVGLESLYPWLKDAWMLLVKEDAISLERLQMAVVWRRVTHMGETRPFGFEYVAAYVFKWDILQRWLAYEPQAASQRFQKLIEEVIGEHAFARS